VKMFGGPMRMFPGPRCGSRRAWCWVADSAV